MARQPIHSPDDQTVTFVELFFDLVFVFSVTQVVALLVGHLSLQGALESLLVFWIVWWAWTQFTWTLNAANTLHTGVELTTLVTTAIAFFMATAIPSVFSGGALSFAVPYVLVRGIGLGLHLMVSAKDPELRPAVRGFAMRSTLGLVAVLAGSIVGGYWVHVGLGSAVFLDLYAAGMAGKAGEWRIRPEHFSERHGLFTIIALGESLIVAANGMTGASWTFELIGVAALAVALICSLWWTYFARTKEILEHALCSRSGRDRGVLARDAFSLAHFPMLCGIVAVSAAVESGLHHFHDPLTLGFRLCLAAGILLFVGGMGLALYLASGRLCKARWILMLLGGAAILSFPALPVAGSLSIAALAVALVAWLEQRSAARASSESSAEVHVA
ncbi:Bacterial low temperature requirement A protein (LtrA) [Planctomycetes bacterium Poly30]|uniref:Bacterial low temperature requirement A protein (LtrA) n=1 Tax=Saltatorellus ferox TaxID=2528018 RepID=A0A518EL27_9BACT|nr:Bacterial low temperature requirement A protein (LtrA) [Planctomycetes bacterium Poly30]